MIVDLDYTHVLPDLNDYGTHTITQYTGEDVSPDVKQRREKCKMRHGLVKQVTDGYDFLYHPTTAEIKSIINAYSECNDRGDLRNMVVALEKRSKTVTQVMREFVMIKPVLAQPTYFKMLFRMSRDHGKRYRERLNDFLGKLGISTDSEVFMMLTE